MTYCQYKADRARRAVRGVEEQIAEAKQPVAGKVSVKRNRSSGAPVATRAVNRHLAAKARGLAGFMHYITNLDNPRHELAIATYHQLGTSRSRFRITMHDLRARPISRPSASPSRHT